jgi:suppressor of fused-like protein
VNFSFGLSDLHGDGRVHDVSGPETPSGFGFELTFRLKSEPGETAPPTWPAAVMQALAKYVFQSGMLNASNILASFFKLCYRSAFTCQ